MYVIYAAYLTTGRFSVPLTRELPECDAHCSALPQCGQTLRQALQCRALQQTTGTSKNHIIELSNRVHGACNPSQAYSEQSRGLGDRRHGHGYVRTDPDKNAPYGGHPFARKALRCFFCYACTGAASEPSFCSPPSLMLSSRVCEVH